MTQENIKLHDKLEQLREELDTALKHNSDLTQRIDQLNETVIEKNTEIQKFKATGFDQMKSDNKMLLQNDKDIKIETRNIDLLEYIVSRLKDLSE